MLQISAKAVLHRHSISWDSMENNPARIKFTGIRIAFYLFSTSWLFLFLFFEDSAAFFGWGFFQMAAAVVGVPLVQCALLIDLIMRVTDARTLTDSGLIAKVVAVAIPAILLAASGAWMYYEYVS